MKLPRIAAKFLDFNCRPEEAAVLVSSPRNAAAFSRTGEPLPLPARVPRIGDQYAFHQVEFMAQQHINMCADACIGMLIAYHGGATNSMERNPRGVLEGLDSDDIYEALKAKGLAVHAVAAKDPEAGWSSDELALALQRHGPMVCSIQLNPYSGHAVLLIGASEGTVVIHDPWRGPKQAMPLERFNQMLASDDERAMLAAGPRVPQRRAALPQRP